MIDEIKEKYGSIHEPMAFNTVVKFLAVNKHALETAHGLFLEHASATNWNMVISNMATYQYWSQKRVIEDV